MQSAATSRPHGKSAEISDGEDDREPEQVQTWNDHLYANGGTKGGDKAEVIQHLKRTSRLKSEDEDDLMQSELPTVAARGRGQGKRETRDPGNYHCGEAK
jgi:hypothetical protein